MNRQMVGRLGKLLLIVVFCWSVPLSGAQEQESAKKPAEQVQRPVNAYRLDFSLNEMEDGKKINTRQYSMNLNTADPKEYAYHLANSMSAREIRIGTRIPVEKKQGEFEYINVGTHIKAGIMEQEKGLLLDVECEINSFADPEGAKTSSIPLLRQMNISAITVAGVGKSVVIGSADDPGSKRQFQLEVTATKLK
jgi:hypothetical protein